MSIAVDDGAAVYYSLGSSDEFNRVTGINTEDSFGFQNIPFEKGDTITLYTKGNIRRLSIQNISSANVTKLTQLESLEVTYSALSALDLSKNVNLVELNCNDCGIKSLDLTKNTKLKKLDVSCNQLSSLDLTKNTALKQLTANYNKFDSFGSVKLPSGFPVNESLKSEQDISELGEDFGKSVKAGEVIDLSKYKSYSNTKSEYVSLVLLPGEDGEGLLSTDQFAIPESDKDMKLVFGNAYADKYIDIEISNKDSLLSFTYIVHILKNSNAPEAPGEASGDIPVDDISGTITSAESTKDFDAQEVIYDDEKEKFVLGEKVEKKDLKLSISPVSAGETLYSKIAKADKNFKKDSARLLAYDITLSNDKTSRFKLKDGINLTLKYPSDMAKDWNKYNYKVYHFVTFDYDQLKDLDEPKIEVIKCTADKNGIHFKAPSFSKFSISVTPKSGGNSSPQTGESTVSLNIIILVILLSTAGITGVFAKRKGELFWFTKKSID